MSETQSAYISLVSVFLRKSARIRGFDLFLSHLRQRTAMTTVATMTTKPAKAEPIMRGSWSCTERSGSSATDEETRDKIQTSDKRDTSANEH